METSCEVIIVAGGLGRRMNSEQPKAFLMLENKTILAYAVDCFTKVEAIAGIIIVVPHGFEDQTQNIIKSCKNNHKVTNIVTGGVRRQDSVQAGLDHLNADTSIVLIHDGARIFTSESLIKNIIQGAAEHKAIIPGIAVADTLKRINDNFEVEATVERRQLVSIQTPQGFEKKLLQQAYRVAWENKLTTTDDSGLVENLGHKVKVTEGDHLNFKLTTPNDLALAKMIIKNHYNKEDK